MSDGPFYPGEAQGPHHNQIPWSLKKIVEEVTGKRLSEFQDPPSAFTATWPVKAERARTSEIERERLSRFLFHIGTLSDQALRYLYYAVDAECAERGLVVNGAQGPLGQRGSASCPTYHPAHAIPRGSRGRRALSRRPLSDR